LIFFLFTLFSLEILQKSSVLFKLTAAVRKRVDVKIVPQTLLGAAVSLSQVLPNLERVVDLLIDLCSGFKFFGQGVVSHGGDVFSPIEEQDAWGNWLGLLG
jgi:hypothetical protein